MNQRHIPKERSRHALLLKLAKGKYDNCYYDLRDSVEESRYGKTDNEPKNLACLDDNEVDTVTWSSQEGSKAEVTKSHRFREMLKPDFCELVVQACLT